VTGRIHAQHTRIFDTGQRLNGNQQKMRTAFAIGQYRVTLRQAVRHQLQARRGVPILPPVRHTLLLHDAT
jgi:hypothetical protein